MKQLRKQLYKSILNITSAAWRPNTRLILAGDNAGWVLDWEIREVGSIAKHLGIRLANERYRLASTPQAIFFANQFFMLNDNWLNLSHKIGFSYFHGLPNTGDSLFDKVYESLCRNHDRVSRIQVSHTQMQDAISQTGIASSKVFLIPIGINLNFFPFRSDENRKAARQKLGIPDSAFVVGSFQKDGVGWGDGNEPKLIKGPDVFLSTLEKLKPQIPELFVLLSGPARGYVKAGLENLHIPYHHVYLDSYPKIKDLFYALDIYLVTSRQEGGPKAILESMAAGVPIISTRVGQAMDLIEHGQNGWLVESEDVDGLAFWASTVRGLNRSSLSPILAKGRATAEANSYNAQIPLWYEFMKGFAL